MAYDMSAFMPSKSAYTNPGEYEATQRSLAYEKATYMSNMDAFYKQLEEDARQFDLTMGFKESELAESRRQADLSADTQRYATDVGAETQRYGYDTQRDISAADRAEQGRQYDLGYGLAQDTLEENIRQFDINTDLSQSELDIANRMADIREQEAQVDFIGDVIGGADLLIGDDGILDDWWDTAKNIWDWI